jgi:hypothetical protein
MYGHVPPQIVRTEPNEERMLVAVSEGAGIQIESVETVNNIARFVRPRSRAVALVPSQGAARCAAHVDPPGRRGDCADHSVGARRSLI